MADGPPLNWNPQLPPPPAGAHTDAQYTADEAILRHGIINQYHDILQQLGYTDDKGNFIPGSVEVEGNRRRNELGYLMNQADLGVTRQQQQRGTLFSGRRGDELAQAQHGLITSRAQLEEDLPRQLAALYSHAGGVIGDYTDQNAGLLAAAAARYVPPAVPPPPDPVDAPAPAPIAPPPLRTAIPNTPEPRTAFPTKRTATKQSLYSQLGY